MEPKDLYARQWKVLEEYSEMMRRSVKDEAQQLLQQWASEAQQRHPTAPVQGNNNNNNGGSSSSSSTTQSLPTTVINAEDPSAVVWFGADQRGYIQGPVSLNSLTRWFQLGYLAPDFRVWKIGQQQWQSVLLVNLLNN